MCRFSFEDLSGELFINDDLILEITLGHVPGDANGDGLINVLKNHLPIADKAGLSSLKKHQPVLLIL